MNKITHGTINLEMAMHRLKRANMEGIANLLQCLIDNRHHGMNHHVTCWIEEGVEYVKWREDKRIDGAATDKRTNDEYYGVRS